MTCWTGGPAHNTCAVIHVKGFETVQLATLLGMLSDVIVVQGVLPTSVT